MTDIKITIDQLKNYLGTGLRCEYIHNTIKRVELVTKTFELSGIQFGNDLYLYFTNDSSFCDQFGCIGKYFHPYEFKPICYRLSDLGKEIEVNGESFVPHEKILQEIISWDGSRKDGDGYFGWDCSTGGDDYQDYWAAINDNFQIEFYTGHPDEGGYMIGQEALHWSYVQKLFEWHFWPFGEEYFNKGLVIDKMKRK